MKSNIKRFGIALIPLKWEIKQWNWEYQLNRNRKFVFYFHFQGWYSFSLGIHFDVEVLNFEVHLPFCFIRIGMDCVD